MSPGSDDWIEYKRAVLSALEDYKEQIGRISARFEDSRLDAANAKSEILAKIESVRREVSTDLEAVRLEAAKLSVKSRLSWALIGSLPAFLAALAMWLSK